MDVDVWVEFGCGWVQVQVAGVDIKVSDAAGGRFFRGWGG